MGLIYERNSKRWNFADGILKVRYRESEMCVNYDRNPESVNGVEYKTDYLRYLDLDWGKFFIIVYGRYRTLYVYVDS